MAETFGHGAQDDRFRLVPIALAGTYPGARVRFLLRTYGAEITADDEGDASDPPVESLARLVDFTTNDPGAPPKPPATIRATLNRLHEANPQPQLSVAHSAAVTEHDWIVVASEAGAIDIGACKTLLRRQGIDARVRPRGADVQIEVPRVDFDEAIHLIERNRSWLRPRFRTSWRKNRRLTILFAVETAMTFAAASCVILFAFLNDPARFDGDGVIPLLILATMAVLFAWAISAWAISPFRPRTDRPRRRDQQRGNSSSS